MDEPINPYAAPQSLTGTSNVLTEAVVSPTIRIVPAGKGLRLVNLIIDYIAQLIVGIAITIAVTVFGGEAAIEALDGIPDAAVGMGLLMIYYIVCEATTGRTLGKVLTGTKVVNDAGGAPSFWQIVGRTITRLLPFEPFSFFGTPTRGWHDSLPKTWVVKV